MFNIHTLGPKDTNCEKAAHYWLEQKKLLGNVILHETLEDAVEKIKKDTDCILLGCIVYPYLHNIVFKNLNLLKLTDCFVMDTHNMLFASRFNEFKKIKSVGSHPAPKDLISEIHHLNPSIESILFNSNSESALQCAKGTVDACITTLKAAESNHLTILHDFGPVPMGFSIHTKIN
ncbi:prephenate dehydratase [Providencia rustigianii]|uniref:Prephenate dehydratase n=1 Tax=Providencia rustigianii TaxID=158850 RepID=A0A379FZ30_9GAMM|nr:prephenate dehydratase domain-containing protein [Providencia rustigianii]SUC33926.1 prephenate dehydratase [Providencia rustigianii]